MKTQIDKQLARLRRVVRKHYVSISTTRNQDGRLVLIPWYNTSDGVEFGIQSTTLESIYDLELCAKRIGEILGENIKFKISN